MKITNNEDSIKIEGNERRTCIMGARTPSGFSVKLFMTQPTFPVNTTTCAIVPKRSFRQEQQKKHPILPPPLLPPPPPPSALFPFLELLYITFLPNIYLLTSTFPLCQYCSSHIWYIVSLGIRLDHIRQQFRGNVFHTFCHVLIFKVVFHVNILFLWWVDFVL